ncbi:MAG: type I pullulanase [Clostridia bacterium]|nr:type I pullulanase [Clostridia bacterium]
MKINCTRIISMLLVLVMLFSLSLTSCHLFNKDQGNQGDEGNNGGENGGDQIIPEDEYTLPKEEGHNQITFYWSHPGVIENCDIWCWWDGKEGYGYTMHPCAYGAKVVINVPVGIDQVGFIVRTDCSDPGGKSWGQATKDGTQEDRFAVIDGEETFIYLKSGDPAQYSSNDGGKTLTMLKKFTIAGMVDFHKIEYNVTPKTTITDFSQIKVYEGDRELSVLSVTNMGLEVSSGIIEVEEELDISKNYRVVIENYGEKAVVPTDVFDSDYFLENYIYDGDDLGAIINGDSTTFKVWAPTASKVVLNLFTSGHEGDAYKSVDMVKGERGVWSHTESCGHGTYYTYTVTTSVGTQDAVDPYAKAAGLNGNRGMVVDLSKTDPEGWSDVNFSSGMNSYSDAVIWEVHVRDFSNKIADSKYKGKYLAFTETGLKNEYGQSVGIDYLKELGITHVHLLPVYDYATVNEADPDSGFNWGYDPKNYNVPEGSYSTDPYNGEVRIREYKEMVMALHEAGIAVVMDVVYNHTYDGNSSFNRIVPYYYYRYTATGANSSASGCGNDTASERYMYGKFMVDSTKYWIEEYNLDGLRFDLMGLHDLATMQKVENAVHAVNPEAIIYGEGWTMGNTIDGSAQANQTQISKIVPLEGALGGIAVFNDAIRDGLKGSVFMTDSKGYISGAGAGTFPGVLFGIKGGSGTGASWKVKNAMVINYMSAHDNNTLWDKLAISNPDNTVEERLAMNRLGATILFISNGAVFFQAGEEMLRTKPTEDGGFDENSYKSSDEVNNIKWDVLKEGNIEYDMVEFYKGLIRMRKAHSIFTTNNSAIIGSTIENGGGKAYVEIDNHRGGKAFILLNPTAEEMTYELNGTWNMVCNGSVAGAESLGTVSGEITVPAYSAIVLVNDWVMNN